MKTISCDICGTGIPFGSSRANSWEDVEGVLFKKMIVETTPGKPFTETTMHAFDFDIKITTYKFNTTDFDVCQKCKLAAIQQAVKDMKP